MIRKVLVHFSEHAFEISTTHGAEKISELADRIDVHGCHSEQQRYYYLQYIVVVPVM